MSVEHLTHLEQAKLAQAKSAARIIGLLVPLGLVGIGAVLFLLWMPRIPNPMATHWNGAGVADGFDSPWVSFVGFTAVGILITSMYFLQHLQMWQAQQKPGAPVWGAMNRLLPAIVLGTVTLIFVMEVGTTVVQLDLHDAGDLGPINGVLFGSLGGGIAAGLVGYLAQPKVRIDARADGETGQPLELADTERAVWLGVATASKPYYWIVGAAIALMLGSTIMLFGSRPFEWVPIIIMLVTFVCVACVTLMCARFTVRIDDAGLSARALTGWPTIRVPADDVARVDVGEIVPFAEFGGWGLRWTGRGTMGIVLRTGEGIRISRKSGKSLTVTLDAAAAAAAVLMAAAKRSEEHHAE